MILDWVTLSNILILLKEIFLPTFQAMNEHPSNKSRAFGGLLFLAVTMGMFLFVSAGTLKYWQGWVWLLIFCGSSGLITLFLMKHDQALLERRLRAGPSG